LVEEYTTFDAAKRAGSLPLLVQLRHARLS
jgi:hypothetical protein